MSQDPDVNSPAEICLADVCSQWVAQYEISCPEAIYQRDDVQASLPELAEKLCSIVGYYGVET